MLIMTAKMICFYGNDGAFRHLAIQRFILTKITGYQKQRFIILIQTLININMELVRMQNCTDSILKYIKIILWEHSPEHMGMHMVINRGLVKCLLFINVMKEEILKKYILEKNQEYPMIILNL